eukprot:CAMPEP_0181334656 /NCGR_PEP_ID=MMETSP1101-20121128/26388_1 /TAXON_ID=46948 /ORGANISM="Rhodomonas abbreviata, Strain Caron Lab Isolate" /LENGTH=448 /DNA_ID=CAMNT_0023444671 /DNA_START=243 /DNA_END=1586 /DNA_ORIENTATION=+
MVSTFLPDSMKYRNLVGKATSDDEVPTAGYLQEELKKLTFEPDACGTVEDAMLARLEKKSANVRLKTLRLMKILVESGAPGFKRDLQRRTQAVRDCLHFRGDPHPTMGDLPSRMVRDVAQEVINAIFDTENTGARQPPPPSATTAPSSSFSAPTNNASSVSSVSSSLSSQQPAPQPKKYAGFGSDSFSSSNSKDTGHRDINSYFSNSAAPTHGSASGQGRDEGMNQLMKAGASAISAGISQLTGNVPKPGLAQDEQGMADHTRGMYAGAGTVSQGAGTVPAGFAVDSSSEHTHGGGGLVVGTTGGAEAAYIPQATPAAVQEPVRSAAGQYEETLVQNITAPGGVRAAPPKEELKALCAKAKSLDMPLLIMLLCSKLEADAWQSRLKTLHVLEALLKAPDEAVVKNVRKLLRGRLQLLQGLTSSPQSSLADLAGKVSQEVEKAEAPPPR